VSSFSWLLSYLWTSPLNLSSEPLLWTSLIPVDYVGPEDPPLCQVRRRHQLGVGWLIMEVKMIADQGPGRPGQRKTRPCQSWLLLESYNCLFLPLDNTKLLMLI
jgi:hypothetical protein